ncbi:MAG: exodeoxyribonuclease VII large subunit [Deltaproteobacteria bacterium]|nr:exodeoxyribonuclease VII large subunit [Deltaproteobacteria bacterium]
MATKQRTIDLVSGDGDGTAARADTGERRQPGVLSPRELLARARANVEHIGLCLVKGEVAELRPHRNGHLFFKLLDLEDRKAALPCALWARDVKRLKFTLEDGLAVVLDGKLGLSDYANVQLTVREVEPVGQGAHELAFRQLKDKLAKEGLFALERKRAPPFLPRAVGVVTSKHGAALHDVLARLFERCPPMHVVVAPTLVQGESAPAEIAAALSRLDGAGLVDVILLVRGGGAREDLIAFDTELVARAVVSCAAPVIAGVGHESDVTIADLVADLRAATPTHAAELAVPRLADLRHTLDERARRLHSEVQHAVTERRVRCQALARRLEQALARGRRQQAERLRSVEARLRRLSPERVLRELRIRLTRLELRLRAATETRQRASGQRLALLAARLDALSPLTVLGRGYAIASRVDDGRVLHAAADAPPATEIRVRLAKGALRARVLDEQ